MKNLLIIYNVIFLLAGNVLLSNIHYMHDHNHNHNHDHLHEHETYECEECIIIENVNNYILDYQEIKFSNNNINLFVSEYYSFIEFNIEQTYLSRAPPIS